MMRWAVLSLVILGCGCSEPAKQKSLTKSSFASSNKEAIAVQPQALQVVVAEPTKKVNLPSHTSSNEETIVIQILEEKTDSSLTSSNEETLVEAQEELIVVNEPVAKPKAQKKRSPKKATVATSQPKKSPLVAEVKKDKPTKKASPPPAVHTCDMPSGVLPSARGCCDANGPYVVGSFLYWKGQFSSLSITTARDIPPTGDRQFTVTKLPNYSYKPGFKVGLGYNFSYDAWDLFLDWTWFHGRSQKSLSDPDQIFLQAPLVGEGVASQVEHKGTSRYNSLDLELGRVFYTGKRLSLRPFAGAKAFWLKYSMVTDFLNAVDSDDHPITDAFNSLTGRTWAIGPRFGIDSRWILGKSNFAFLMNAAGSLVWERFHQSIKSDYVSVSTNGGEGKFKLGNVNPVGELFAGFDWGTCISKWLYLNLSAGYEMQYLSGQVIDTVVNNTEQAYIMMGLTASFRLDF